MKESLKKQEEENKKLNKKIEELEKQIQELQNELINYKDDMFLTNVGIRKIQTKKIKNALKKEKRKKILF